MQKLRLTGIIPHYFSRFCFNGGIQLNLLHFLSCLRLDLMLISIYTVYYTYVITNEFPLTL